MGIEKRLTGRLCLSLLWMAVVGLVAVGEASEELCVPLETITLEAPAGVRAERNPVAFPHGQHFAMACTVCHHKWTGTAENLNCTAAGCHDLGEVPAKGSTVPGHRYFKNAYHASCIGCHKKIKLANQAAELAKTVATVQQAGGPTGCVECHSR
jgi:hypothetical protein